MYLYYIENINKEKLKEDKSQKGKRIIKIGQTKNLKSINLLKNNTTWNLYKYVYFDIENLNLSQLINSYFGGTKEHNLPTRDINESIDLINLSLAFRNLNISNIDKDEYMKYFMNNMIGINNDVINKKIELINNILN